jgi:outer membrane protein
MAKKIEIILKGFIVLFSTLISINIAGAKDIVDYLSNSYRVSDTLKVEQMKFKNEVEKYPSAISAFLPSVNYTISSENQALKKIPTSNAQSASGLTVGIPIFNGGSSMANLRIAENLYYVARLNWYLAEQNFILSSIKTYLSYYKALKIYSISAVSVEATKKQLESAEARLRLGEGTRTESAYAQSSYSEALAQQSAALSKLVETKANFISTFGYDDENILLPKIPELGVNNSEDLKNKMLSSNLELNKAKYGVNVAKLKTLANVGRLAPSVSANLNVSDGGAGKNIYKAGLSLNIPIFDATRGNVYSDTRSAKNDLRASVFTLSDATKTIRDQANVLWYNLESGKLQLQYTKEASNAAKMAYDGTVKEQTVGNKTILDVLEAQAKWYNMQLKEVTAQKNFLMLAYTIKQQIGELTARSLKLKVEIFNPENEFKKTKLHVVGL